MIKHIIYFLQSILVYICFVIARILGLNLSRKIFAFLFLSLGSFFKSKKIIFKNLNFFSKVATNPDKEKIIKSMWKNYGMTFIEYVFLDYFKKKNNIITIKDNADLQKIHIDKKPVIFISGHFANFELMSMEITKKNIPLATIYRPLNNIFLNPFMEYLRKKYICKNQIKKGINGVRDAIEYIKGNHSIALMIDQRVSEGTRLNFFGKPALTTTLPAQLAIKYNMDIIPVFIERKNSDKFEIEFLEKINPKEYDDKQKLSRKLNDTLEEMIKRNPNQWIWSHNRWK